VHPVQRWGVVLGVWLGTFLLWRVLRLFYKSKLPAWLLLGLGVFVGGVGVNMVAWAISGDSGNKCVPTMTAIAENSSSSIVVAGDCPP
jgi:hypothetical protein